MSSRFPFVPRLATFRTFPHYPLKTRFSFLLVFLRYSYSRSILGVQFSSPTFFSVSFITNGVKSMNVSTSFIIPPAAY